MKKEGFVSEDWEEWKESAKKTRELNRKVNTNDLELICVENDIDLRKHTEYHYSLFKCDIRIDFYPTSGKWHNVNTGKRGRCNARDLPNLIKTETA